jgi:hypothetical protein
MARSFQVKLTDSSEALVEKAKKVAAETNATFSGDTQAGSFSGDGVEGSYTINGDTVTVTISTKPFYAPWFVVESRVREFFT